MATLLTTAVIKKSALKNGANAIQAANYMPSGTAPYLTPNSGAEYNSDRSSNSAPQPLKPALKKSALLKRSNTTSDNSYSDRSANSGGGGAVPLKSSLKSSMKNASSESHSDRSTNLGAAGLKKSALKSTTAAGGGGGPEVSNNNNSGRSSRRSTMNTATASSSQPKTTTTATTNTTTTASSAAAPTAATTTLNFQVSNSSHSASTLATSRTATIPQSQSIFQNTPRILFRDDLVRRVRMIYKHVATTTTTTTTTTESNNGNGNSHVVLFSNQNGGGKTSFVKLAFCPLPPGGLFVTSGGSNENPMTYQQSILIVLKQIAKFGDNINNNNTNNNDGQENELRGQVKYISQLLNTTTAAAAATPGAAAGGGGRTLTRLKILVRNFFRSIPFPLVVFWDSVGSHELVTLLDFVLRDTKTSSRFVTIVAMGEYCSSRIRRKRYNDDGHARDG